MRINKATLIWVVTGLLVGAAICAFAKDYGTIDTFQLIEVHDGDTIIGNIPGQYPVFGKRIAIRILGIDAPELDGDCEQERVMAREATEALKQLVADQAIILNKTKRDGRFRVVAQVVAGDVDVATELLAMGLVVPYDGKAARSQDWCKEDLRK